MTNDELEKTFNSTLTWLMRTGASVALLPIEEFLEAFSHAETVGAILDPTLLRDYLESGKGAVIKDVLRAALVFKRAIQKAQQEVMWNERLRQ